jgi:hypothetical protein
MNYWAYHPRIGTEGIKKVDAARSRGFCAMSSCRPPATPKPESMISY